MKIKSSKAIKIGDLTVAVASLVEAARGVNSDFEVKTSKSKHGTRVRFDFGTHTPKYGIIAAAMVLSQDSMVYSAEYTKGLWGQRKLIVKVRAHKSYVDQELAALMVGEQYSPPPPPNTNTAFMQNGLDADRFGIPTAKA